jgi:hypothetical protein
MLSRPVTLVLVVTTVDMTVVITDESVPFLLDKAWLDKGEEEEVVTLLGVLEKLDETPELESPLDPPNENPESPVLKSQLPN